MDYVQIAQLLWVHMGWMQSVFSSSSSSSSSMLSIIVIWKDKSNRHKVGTSQARRIFFLQTLRENRTQEPELDVNVVSGTIYCKGGWL